MHKKRIISYIVLLTLLFSFAPMQISVVSTVQASFHTIQMNNSKEIHFPQQTRTGVFMWQTTEDHSEHNEEEEHVHTEPLYYRVQEKNGEWTQWNSILEDHDGAHEEVGGTHYSQMLFFPETQHMQIQVTEEEEHMLDMTFIAFQETRNFRFTTVEIPKSNAQDSISIVSRTDWGADPAWIEKDTWEAERAKVCVAKPSYCVTSPEAEKAVAEKAKKLQEDYPEDTKISERITSLNGKELYWAISKSDKIRKLFVHHTAELTKDVNGDGTLDTADERAVMRNTYYFHSLVRGWGDIGYNFIVGPSGTIYEGRAGGDKVVAAHAVWRNISSIGVSTMGNFEKEDIATPQLTGLANILGFLSKKYALDPEGTTVFYGKTDHSILGHRDSPAAATACPGANLYAKLPQLRKLTTEAMKMLLSTTIETPANTSSNGYGISFIPLENVISFRPTEEKTITINVKNTGTKEWPKGATLRMNTGITLFEILSGNKTTQALYVLPNTVAAGKTVAMNISLRALYSSFSDAIALTVVLPNGVTSSSFLLPVTISAGTNKYEHVKTTQPKQELLFNEEAKFLFQVKNTGSTTWYSTYLHGIAEERGSVKVQSGTIALRETSVAPGAIGTIEIPVKAPIQAGSYTMDVTLFLQEQKMSGGTLLLQGTVTHPYHAQLFSLQPEVSSIKTVPQGATSTVSIFLKNTSSFPWTGLSKMDISMDAQKTIPLRATSTIRFPKDYIQPGEVIELTIPLHTGYTAISQPTVQFTYLGLPITKSALTLPITVTQENTSAQVVSGSWNQGKLDIKVHNTGTSTWSKERVFLELQNVPSSLQMQWEKEFGHFIFQESSVPPGAYAHFIVPSKDFISLENTTLALAMDMGEHIAVSGQMRVKNDTPGIPPLEFGATLKRFLAKFPLFAR